MAYSYPPDHAAATNDWPDNGAPQMSVVADTDIAIVNPSSTPLSFVTTASDTSPKNASTPLPVTAGDIVQPGDTAPLRLLAGERLWVARAAAGADAVPFTILS